MESYVEVSFLQQLLTMLLSLRLVQSICLQPVLKGVCYGYAISISFLSVCLWLPSSELVIAGIEMLFLFIYFRHAYKTYAMAFVLRVLLMLSGWVLYDGSFHNGMWFVPMDYRLVYWWLLYALLFFLHAAKWKDIIAKHSYVYEVKLYSEVGILSMKGYLDSGNLLSHQGIPVIFLDRSMQAYFKNERIQWVVMKGIGDEKAVKCYMCKIALANTEKQNVLVYCGQKLELPFHCKALLNVHLMTMG